MVACVGEMEDAGAERRWLQMTSGSAGEADRALGRLDQGALPNKTPRLVGGAALASGRDWLRMRLYALQEGWLGFKGMNVKLLYG